MHHNNASTVRSDASKLQTGYQSTIPVPLQKAHSF